MQQDLRILRVFLIFMTMVLVLVWPVPADMQDHPDTSAGSGEWTSGTIISPAKISPGADGPDGKYLSFVLDRDDRPHISYFDADLGQVIYVTREDGRWTEDTVGQSSGTSSTSIAVNTPGNPSIVFGDAETGKLIYAEKMGSLWKTTVVDREYHPGRYSSLAIDAEGNPHISYSNGETFSSLRYAVRRDQWWNTSTVDTGVYGRIIGNTGYDSSIRLDDAGRPRISYRDGNTFGSMMYAEYDGTLWNITKADTGWGGRPDTRDITGDTGYYSSLVLDHNDPVITYYDKKNQLLMMASRSRNGVWNTMFWNSPGEYLGGRDLGKYSSVAIDNAGKAYISYYDATNGDLRYLHARDSGVQYGIVDSEGDVGRYSVLALDSSGSPHIVYYDATNGAIKYAKWTGQSFS
jgi:hypothetical protein